MKKCAYHMFLSAFLAAVFFYLAGYLTNVFFWLVMAAGLIGCVFAFGNVVRLGLLFVNRPMSFLPYQQTALVVAGLTLVVVCTEWYLGWREQGMQPAPTNARVKPVEKSPIVKLAPEVGRFLTQEALDNIARRRGVLTLPAEWQRRSVTVPGAERAEMWHGVLHIYDQNKFRRASPFPPKRAGTFRLMIVGDSMTYGDGVDEKFIYASLLQKVLKENFNIEVLTLGNDGAQSEDVLNLIRKFLPQLKPDLLFYGVVQNDFLPSGKGQYTSRGYEFPIPASLENILVTHSRFAGLVRDSYDAALRSIGLRAHFFDDILKDFGGYQQRFARDVGEMNRLVTGNGLPPVIAMVLDQFPAYGGRGYKITQVAERLMKQAGMDVIETEGYYRRFNNYNFRVSLWEGHADEEGHALFASMILPKLEKHPGLQPFRKARPQTEGTISNSSGPGLEWRRTEKFIR